MIDFRSGLRHLSRARLSGHIVRPRSQMGEMVKTCSNDNAVVNNWELHCFSQVKFKRQVKISHGFCSNGSATSSTIGRLTTSWHLGRWPWRDVIFQVTAFLRILWVHVVHTYATTTSLSWCETHQRQYYDCTEISFWIHFTNGSTINHKYFGKTSHFIPNFV